MKRKMALLVATTAITAAQAVIGRNMAPCMMVMYPCKDYVMLRGTEQQPSPECCAAFAGAVEDQLPCICSILMNGSSAFAASINVTRATKLPSSCNVRYASQNCTSIDNEEEQPLPSTHRLSSLQTVRSTQPPTAPEVVAAVESSRDSLSTAATAGIVVGILFFVFSVTVIALIWHIRRKRARRQQGGGTRQAPYHPQPQYIPSGSTEGAFSTSSEKPTPQRMSPRADPLMGGTRSTFTFEEMAMATGGFARENLLGQGGFGEVHKGVLPNGKEVAIKQLRLGSKQGEREFQAELETIRRVHHKHLVSLVGYCVHENRRLLVYEFVPNGTLAFHLHAPGQRTMDWSKRLRVALGSARGLAYLHEDCSPRIIHRDVKGSNILLDFNFDAKVADFGLARFAAEFETHVSTRIMGTIGYLDPEYASKGKLTAKSDVFSYGVVLLELITGHRPIIVMQDQTEESLVDWAEPLLTRALKGNDYDAFIDPYLKHDYDGDEMARLVACAAACIRRSARERPKMSQVVRILEGDVSLDELHQGVFPGHGTIHSPSSARSSRSRDDMEGHLRQRRALGVQEHASSEYSPSDTSTAYGGGGHRS